MVIKTDVFETTKNYIKMLSKLVTSLQKAKPKDRLDYSVEITNCLNAVMITVKGWNAWLTNLESLKVLSLEDLQQAYPKLLKTSIAFLKIDIEITKKKLLEATTKYSKQKQKPAKVVEPYVS